MNIALIGYGKMGRMIEKIALSRGHTIVARLTSSAWNPEALQHAHICMEFTQPASIIENVKRLAELKKDIVIGTTGWDDKVDQVKSIVHEHHIGALHSPNFSTGIALLLDILNHASKAISAFEEYDAAGIEYHHAGKRDRPSGTALKIVKAIEENMECQIPFTSVRCGSIPGIHTVLFDSPHDTISITHEARSREGFADGAVQAAEWLCGRKGFYTFADCLKDRMRK